MEYEVEVETSSKNDNVKSDIWQLNRMLKFCFLDVYKITPWLALNDLQVV